VKRELVRVFWRSIIEAYPANERPTIS